MDAALAILRQRRGTWFEPALAKVVLGWRRDRARWESLHRPDTIAAVVELPTEL